MSCSHRWSATCIVHQLVRHWKERTAREIARKVTASKTRILYTIQQRERKKKTKCVIISRSRFVAAICEFWSMPGARNMPVHTNLAHRTSLQGKGSLLPWSTESWRLIEWFMSRERRIDEDCGMSIYLEAGYLHDTIDSVCICHITHQLSQTSCLRDQKATPTKTNSCFLGSCKNKKG